MGKPETAEALEDLMDAGDTPAAYRRGMRAIENGSRDGSLYAAVAEAALRRGHVSEAVQLARRGVSVNSGSAAAHFRLGQCLQFAGAAVSESDAEFYTAAMLDGKTHVVPHRIAPQAFDDLARRAVEQLRRDLKRLLDSRTTTVRVVPLPDLERVVSDGLDPFAVVHHISNPLGLPDRTYFIPWGSSPVPLPDVIELHQLSIENWCADDADLRREIKGAVEDGVREVLGVDADDDDAEPAGRQS